MTSIVEKIQHTEGCSTETPESNTEFIGEFLPRNPNERWTTDPNPNLPKEMTVLQAENQDHSDSEQNSINFLNFIFYLDLKFYYLYNR